MDKFVLGLNYGGFFSICNIILRSIINYFNSNKKLPKEIVCKQGFLIYKIHDNQDIYKEFFEIDQTEIEFKKEIKFNNEGFENQFSEYKLLNFNDLHPIFNKYFKPNNTILNNVTKLQNKYNIDFNDEYCGVFYRGNDKIIETQKPQYSEIILKAKEVKKQNENIKFIVQTDEKEFLDAFLNEFPSSIFFSEMQVISSSSNTNVSKLLNNENKMSHIVNFVSIIYLFSKLKYLITTSGNCEFFIILYRNNAENVNQYLKKNKYIHGVLNKEYDENNTQVWY